MIFHASEQLCVQGNDELNSRDDFSEQSFVVGQEKVGASLGGRRETDSGSGRVLRLRRLRCG